MAMAFAVPALAGEWDNPTYTSVQGSDGTSGTVPVEGYVGEAVPDPGVPTTTYEVNVAVPVKLMWAAFESDGGTLTAPDYRIQNYSHANDLDVTLTSFSATGPDNTTVDPDLTLTITADSTPTSSPMAGTQLVTSDGTTATYYSSSVAFTTTLNDADVTDGSDVWNFSLGGTWNGSTFPSTALTPTYNMVFTFAL
jgi:hypothetical protein